MDRQDPTGLEPATGWSPRPAIHPACGALPPLPPKAMDELVSSIKAIGLQQPILRDRDGLILDGKNRLRACEIAKVEPRFAEADLNGTDPLTFVLDLNRQRLRTPCQLALTAARLATTTVGRPPNISATGGHFDRAAAAQICQVSLAAVDRAKYVLEHGCAELISFLEYGDITLRVAYDAAHAPMEDQEAQCALNAKAVRDLARRVKAALREPAADGTEPPSAPRTARNCPDVQLACRLIDVGYKQLAAIMHPDKAGGDTADMQKLNALRVWLNAMLGVEGGHDDAR